MKKQTQHGKGLSGFFSGLLLATAVIIGILFFLNKENRGEFKEVKPAKEVSETEVLQPKGNRTKPRQEEEPETVPNQGGVAGGESKPETDKETPSQTATKQAEPETVPEVGGETSKPVVAEPKTEVKPQHQAGEAAGSEAVAQEASSAKPETGKTVEPKTETEKKTAGLTDKQKARIERKLAEKKAAEHKAAAKKDSGQKESKPTPEQILNSGSIEKARAEHKAAQAKEEAKKAVSGDNSAKASSGGRKVVLQMGSYVDRKSAETQRAKLAMMGISSSVVESTANGKDVYRVQSAAMAQDDAKNVQQTLQKHGVNSFARSVK
ncbi:SPOR domain-containing protein [uncultured Neisseria sp.]|uniref:SPOR domain-containing protein n=1 Tax=uncultured Neisseria sp. TaxID=237778 RepID=UPI00260A6291|nr:SPOR domain-containing protein [uncultured Neisseria sp.]